MNMGNNNNNNNNNIPNLVLSVSVCLLLLIFHGSLATTEFQQQDQKCQLNRLEALEADNEIAAQRGSIYTWNPNQDQFQCAGVALARYVIEYEGFLLPSYSNAPQLLYIHRGSGIVGVVFPGGCQKLHRLRGSNLIVIPAGVAFWAYCESNEEPFEAISLLHTGNQLIINQLDPTPRRFYLAGNPEDEFAPYRQQQQQQKSSSANNVFGGFDTHRLADSLNLNVDTIRKLQGDSNDNRKNIVRVDGELGLDMGTTPPINNNRQQYYSNQGSSSQSHECGDDDDDDANNASIDDDDDIYSCSISLNHDLLYHRPDRVYTLRGGYIFTVNSSIFPILKHLRLTVEAGYVPKNFSYVPHWNTNAHALHGYAKVQVVNDKGQSVFDGEFRDGQALVVPQNYAVVINGIRKFLWVAFKTNENAVITLAGPKSFIRTLPEGVLQNIYNLSRDKVENFVKYNRSESTFAMSWKSSY